MMKRLVSWLFFVLLGVLALLLVLPGFIDWSRHKDLLVTELGSRLGQEIRIDGEVSLRFLPNPHLSLEQVRIGEASKDGYLVSLAMLDARMSMDQLLHGKFVIDQIHVQDPVINVSITENGSNWRGFWAVRAGKDRAASSADMVALKQLTVSHASIVYHNHTSGQEWTLPRINMTLTADSLAGPYQARGEMTYGDEPLTFTLVTQPRDENGGLPFSLDVNPIENLPEVKATGVFAPLADVPLSVTVEARNGKPAALFAPFGDIAAVAGRIDALKGNGQATFKMALRDAAVAFTDIKASSTAGATLAGHAVYHPGRDAIDADATLTSPGAYWLSYDGAIDAVRGEYAGRASWKIEDASHMIQHAPPVSVEAQGQLSYESAEHWSFEKATVNFPEWPGVSFEGQVQRVQDQTGFVLATAQAGFAENVSLNGQFAQTLTADGTASVFGKPVTFTLAGDPARPELAASSLAGVAPRDVLAALGVAPKGVSLDGGGVSFKGYLDLKAPSLAQVLAGQVSLTPQKLSIAAFDPAALQKTVLALESGPDDLAKRLLAALEGAQGSFTAQPIAFTVPLAERVWQMKGIAYEGGSFDFGVAGSDATVSVTAQDATGLSYKGKLALKEEDMPLKRAGELIIERHPPAPQVDTTQAIGGILDRLDETPTAPADEAGAVVKPPQPDSEAPEQVAPPQPEPPLQEIEVAPPPPLPQDTPLSPDIPLEETDAPSGPLPAHDIPDEIFPLEEEPEGVTPP